MYKFFAMFPFFLNVYLFFEFRTFYSIFILCFQFLLCNFFRTVYLGFIFFPSCGILFQFRTFTKFSLLPLTRRDVSSFLPRKSFSLYVLVLSPDILVSPIRETRSIIREIHKLLRTFFEFGNFFRVSYCT